MPFNCFGLYLCRANEPCTCMQTTQLGSMFKSPAQAEQWLQMFSRNGLTMMGLRDVAAKCGLGSANTSDNGSILKVLALQIYSGHLRVCSMGGMGGSAGIGGSMGSSARSGTTAGGGEDSKPFPISERKKPASSTPDEPPPDPSTFADDPDGSTQASALTAAAADGQPFCPE